MTKLDISRARQAALDLHVEGVANTPMRRALIEEAIAAIQRNPTFLMDGYLGIKIYAGFGEQREDHSYGMGPRHGTIVFRIGRTQAAHAAKAPLGPEHIYLLEAVRDFKGWQYEDNGRTRLVDLPDTIRALDAHHATSQAILKALEGADVEAHA